MLQKKKFSFIAITISMCHRMPQKIPTEVHKFVTKLLFSFFVTEPDITCPLGEPALSGSESRSTRTTLSRNKKEC